MTVTDIVELDKKRSKIYIDGEFAFVLYKGELREYGIKVGADILESTYEEITGTLLTKRAKLRAMNLLQKKDYTEKQLRDKLNDGLYPDNLVDEAISYVKSYKYLDDERFARDYITYHLEMRSKNRIIQDLMGKGLSKDFIVPIYDELCGEANENSDTDIEQAQIEKLLSKKHYSEDLEYNDKQKIMAFLMRRGYSIESIKRAMNHYE
ncbi:regulatory protein RecX [Butyrivibrio sp. VCB2006]|uniref:regulatory protein RecX n=1 Tax=Butyrivibrio sp. VCB2006 TaxID=1280679 RepID=UPI000409BAEC|nr:regulatory protein RecX [Butyrivibrio sp. VCB2006]